MAIRPLLNSEGMSVRTIKPLPISLVCSINFYDSGVLSADDHQWANQAFAPDYMERLFTDFNRSYPSNGGDSLDLFPGELLVCRIIPGVSRSC
jgi:hypothetical protein